MMVRIHFKDMDPEGEGKTITPLISRLMKISRWQEFLWYMGSVQRS